MGKQEGLIFVPVDKDTEISLLMDHGVPSLKIDSDADYMLHLQRGSMQALLSKGMADYSIAAILDQKKLAIRNGNIIYTIRYKEAVNHD